ncbi:DinB family protein [Chryseobacterium sp.]|uniref:DinB family protein n=1 Tax=Chryseobacterium sp. TaxID=1871047 RepID=UPI0025B93036|nr:DinB family protein [Chryseobacterium sp.]
MKISTSQLISDLKDIIQGQIQYVEMLLQKSDGELNFRMTGESWSALECIKHLNLYGDFYIPEIGTRIRSSKTSPSTTFSPGWLGDYFAKSMLPKEKLNTMKTFKAMNPIHSKLDKEVLNEFIRQQQQLLSLLDKAKSINLEKTKTSISISKFVKLKLGDTLRFIIYHQIRHIEQVKKVLKSV